MDILIKSFNRPYYLDRCIQSIYKHVVDTDLAIKILDDGTPQKYLDKLTAKYPDIRIYKSDSYTEKAAKSNAGSSDASSPVGSIPIQLWIEAARNATDYFLLLEDDIWITEAIDLNKTEDFLTYKNVFFLKLFWLGNPKLIKGFTIEKNDLYTVYQPKVFTRNPLLFRIIFKTARFKLRQLMTLLNVYTKERALDYYSMYSVAGVVFKRSYFVSLWKQHSNVVDEYLQIQNALRFWSENKAICFARSNREMVRTGFMSSATHKNYTADLDIFAFNKILNEAWYEDQFDPMKNFPYDLEAANITAILDQKQHPRATNTAWKDWVGQFKNQFRAIGCKID